MCWLSKNDIQYTAESRIPVYKIMIISGVLTRVLRSFYRGAIYDLHTNHINGLETPEKCVDGTTLETKYRIDIGLHSYGVSNTTCNRYDSQLMVVSKNTRETLDSYPICPTGFYISNLAKVFGYIPVGAKYYVNEHGEYVSNEIVLTDIEEYTRN